MAEVLVLLALETAVTMTLLEMNGQRRVTTLHKWYRGELSESELRALKQAHWFQKQFPKREVSREKKTN